jgi:hypothetical protein
MDWGWEWEIRIGGGEKGGCDACAAGMSYAECVYLRIRLEYEYMRMVGYLSCEFKGTFIS